MKGKETSRIFVKLKTTKNKYVSILIVVTCLHICLFFRVPGDVYYDKNAPETGEEYSDNNPNRETKQSKEAPQNYNVETKVTPKLEDDPHSYNSGKEKGDDSDSRRYQQEQQDQYRGSRDRLDDQRDRYGGSRDRLDDQRDHYRGSRDRLDDQRDRYGGSRDRLDDRRDRNGGSRDRLDDQRNRHGGSRDRLDDQGDRYGGGRDYRSSRDHIDYDNVYRN